MGFRPGNIRVINRRDSRLDRDLRRLPRAGQKRNQDRKYQLTGRFILGVQPTL
jgi:hypothetical protein